ncbi:hypothetical protein O181_013032 [Austropuccinia psidii MF-1]|uniref:Uncharacterized protein n=1 Tax=Austropuccinia psidii MF-1 TaxID=1389203 RepID=A0A9Q3BXH8_9BASI|nr:hypothetical protein [Austropuccinia psidii MF-1]
MPIISKPELELSMSHSNRNQSHSEGLNRHTYEPVQAVLNGAQGQGLGNFATSPPRSNELQAYSQKAPQRGGDSEILQWMESTVIQAPNQKDKGVPCQKVGYKQGKSPSSFYQKPTSQPNSPRGEEEQEKELEETIFHKLQDPKNPKGCHRKCFQHFQNFDGIQGQRGEKNEATPFPKEIPLSPDVVKTSTEIKYIILALKDIRNRLLFLK